MTELKKQLIEACNRKLDYYDIVDEELETIDYEKIIDVLFNQICKIILKVGAEDAK